MATQPVLGSTTLPHPAGYRETPEWRGAMAEMADGTVVTHLVQTGAKRSFTLRWTGLTATDVGNVETAWTGIKQSSASFTSPRNVSYTVTLDPQQQGLEWEWYLVKGGTELRANGELRLREA